MTPVRHHMLKAVGRAPALGKFVMGGGEAVKETRSIETGDGLHTLLFRTKPVIFYPKARDDRHKEYQAFKEAHPRSLILTKVEYDLAHRMVEAVLANHDADFLLKDCPWFEETLLFDWMGRACRTTPDARGHNRVIELKQAKTAQPSKFSKVIEWESYDTQLAFHRIGAAETSLDDRQREAFIIAVEPTPPHLVCCFQIWPRMLARAEETLERWMSRLLECEASGTWPGYSSGIVKVDLPEDHQEARAA